jgi:hypothetical protein
MARGSGDQAYGPTVVSLTSPDVLESVARDCETAGWSDDGPIMSGGVCRLGRWPAREPTSESRRSSADPQFLPIGGRGTSTANLQLLKINSILVR